MFSSSRGFGWHRGGRWSQAPAKINIAIASMADIVEKESDQMCKDFSEPLVDQVPV